MGTERKRPVDAVDLSENAGDQDDADDYAEDADIEDGFDLPIPHRSAKTRVANGLSRIKHFVLQSDPSNNVEDHVPHYRWTPIVTGVIIPFSILLEIPGLTEHWYIRTIDNKTVETRRNSLLLDIGLGLSMACAVIANIAVIVRFFEKHIKTMTILAICALSVHDIINTTAVTTFAVLHRFDDGFTYGQSFWFTMCSTIASLVTNVTLIWDLRRTSDFSTSGSGLTRKQRSLVIIVMILLCWIALGALINSLLAELSFIDGLYFTVVTIETVGFGDIVPHSTASRIFSALHGTIGILNLALAVATCRETIIESFEHSYREKFRALRAKRRERREHRAEARARKVALKKQLLQAGLPVYVPGTPPGGGRVRHTHRGHLNIEALTDEQRQAALREALERGMERREKRRAKKAGHDQGDLSFRTRGRTGTYTSDIGSDPDNNDLSFRTRGRTATFASDVGSDTDHDMLSFRTRGRTATFASDTGADDNNDLSFRTRGRVLTMTSEFSTDLDTGSPDAEKNYSEFVAKEQQREFSTKLTVVWSLFFTFWMIGSAIFMRTEGWSFGIALWFCFISFSTIGFGDFTPVTPAGRSVFIVWALLGVGTMTILISVLSEAYSSRYKMALSHSDMSSSDVNSERLHDLPPRRRHIRITASPSAAQSETNIPPAGPRQTGAEELAPVGE